MRIMITETESQIEKSSGICPRDKYRSFIVRNVDIIDAYAHKPKSKHSETV